MRYTFPKKLLFKKADFNTLFKQGKRRHGSFFILYHYPITITETVDIKRFGLVVGKKAVGTNVKRNLVKRVIREAYRLQQHAFSQEQILILAKRNLKEISAKALRQDLDNILKKAHAQ